MSGDWNGDMYCVGEWRVRGWVCVVPCYLRQGGLCFSGSLVVEGAGVAVGDAVVGAGVEVVSAAVLDLWLLRGCASGC